MCQDHDAKRLKMYDRDSSRASGLVSCNFGFEVKVGAIGFEVVVEPLKCEGTSAWVCITLRRTDKSTLRELMRG